jgi:hypothetical protein
VIRTLNQRWWRKLKDRCLGLSAKGTQKSVFLSPEGKVFEIVVN